MAGVWDVLNLKVQAALGEATAGVYNTARYNQDVYGVQAALPWLDIKCDVVGLEIARSGSRDPVLTFRPEPGTLALTLYDPAGDYDPNNPAGPHYQYLRPRLPLRVLLSGTPVATALVDSITHDPAAGRTIMNATDGIALLASVIADVIRPGENSRTRMQALRDVGAAGSPIAPALVMTGAGITLKSSGFDGDIWSMMLATAQVDRGLLLLDGAGVLNYSADWDVIAGTPVATIGCPHKTADAHAHTWTTAVDTDLLVNTVTARSVGTDGETDQQATAADQGSVQTFGASSAGGEVILPLDPTGLAKWADDAVRLGAWPWPRTASLGITLLGTEATAPNELAVWWALDLADTITWQGHDRPAERLAVVGVRHQINEQGQYVGELTLGKPRVGAGYNDPSARYGQVAYV